MVLAFLPFCKTDAEASGVDVLDELWRNDLARAAPCGKEVDDDNLIVLDGSVEIGLAVKGTPGQQKKYDCVQVGRGRAVRRTATGCDLLGNVVNATHFGCGAKESGSEKRLVKCGISLCFERCAEARSGGGRAAESGGCEHGKSAGLRRLCSSLCRRA